MKGAKSLLDRINNLQDAVNNAVPEAIEKEVDRIGKGVGQQFDNANYYGINDTEVATFSNNVNGKRSWSIVAEGESVLFIEYGSGINLKHDSQFAGAPYAPASWSATHAGFLVSPLVEKWKGFWRVPKSLGLDIKYTEGNPSNNIMYEAIKTLRDSAPRIGNRELKKALK